ncbi:MAG TPA: Rieske (2Fe-2S) protein [Planctomycetota bacterium]
MATQEPVPESESAGELDRRRFLAGGTTVAMAGGLAVAYGTCGAMGGRFLYPARPAARRWQFLARVDALADGQAMTWKAPTGDPIVIARRGTSGEAEDFVALSSTCPHLGCQVHWEGHRNRFFCPCHNGVFDPAGVATAGPPAQAGQALMRFPLRRVGPLLFIEVTLESLGSEA